jgi:hypothetical protein
MSLPSHTNQAISFSSPRERVEFLVDLLAAHRALEEPHSLHWHERERELVSALAFAQVALDEAESVVLSSPS